MLFPSFVVKFLLCGLVKWLPAKVVIHNSVVFFCGLLKVYRPIIGRSLYRLFVSNNQPEGFANYCEKFRMWPMRAVTVRYETVLEDEHNNMRKIYVLDLKKIIEKTLDSRFRVLWSLLENMLGRVQQVSEVQFYCELLCEIRWSV